MQLTDLRRYAERMEWEAVEFIEKESSVKDRPVFNHLLEEARSRKIDVLLVWRIDRFARSMRDFVNITLELKSRNVRLISATENVDTGDENPMSKFLIGLLALLAELERNILINRVNAGIAEAKRKGKHCGRPKRIWNRDHARQLREQGWTFRKIAQELGVPKSSLQVALVQKVSR